MQATETYPVSWEFRQDRKSAALLIYLRYTSTPDLVLLCLPDGTTELTFLAHRDRWRWEHDRCNPFRHWRLLSERQAGGSYSGLEDAILEARTRRAAAFGAG